MRSPVFRWAGLTGSLLAILLTVGGHWFVLQSFAWGRMLVQYSRSSSLLQAAERTFDGKHPCELCLQIRSARQHENQQQAKSPSLKAEVRLDLFCERTDDPAALPTTAGSDAIGFVPRFTLDLSYAPPKPRPRA